MTLPALLKTQEEQRLDKFLSYIAHGVEPTQAGGAVGYSPARVLELLDASDIEEAIEEKRQEQLTNSLDINAQYDRIEENALTNLEAAIKISADPDLNLRVAMLANRAQRRGRNIGPTNVPLNGANGGVVHIDLSTNFIKIVNNKTRKTTTISLDDEADFASPAQIDELIEKNSESLNITGKPVFNMKNILSDDN